MRVAIIASTAGSVYRAVSSVPFIRSSIVLVVSDRECGAVQTARELGHDVVIIPHPGGPAFSDALLDLAKERGIDLLISFYTRLFVGRVIDAYRGRFVNFHPSILPACPGPDGFGDTIRSGARFVGSTVHLVDAGMDTGWPLLQASLPNDPATPLGYRRHKVFLQQCKALVQIVRWYADDRIRLDNGGLAILGARFDLSEFSPNLDCPDAIRIDIPYLEAC